MAKKKFGKFLLFSAAVGAVAAGAYYYFQNKEKISNDDFDDDDFDDFSEDLDSDKVNHSDAAERSYVSLDMDSKEEPAAKTTSAQETSAEPSTEKSGESNTAAKEVLSTLEKAAESAKAEVEEFFDDDEDDSYDGN